MVLLTGCDKSRISGNMMCAEEGSWENYQSYILHMGIPSWTFRRSEWNTTPQFLHTGLKGSSSSDCSYHHCVIVGILPLVGLLCLTGPTLSSSTKLLTISQNSFILDPTLPKRLSHLMVCHFSP